MKAVPDRVFVWNEFQAREAVDLHGLEYERIVVTGAQLFDTWFARSPSTSRQEFLASAGLPPGSPFVLYVGSSRNIAPAGCEIAFVLRWLRELRAGGERELGVVIGDITCILGGTCRQHGAESGRIVRIGGDVVNGRQGAAQT